MILELRTLSLWDSSANSWRRAKWLEDKLYRLYSNSSNIGVQGCLELAKPWRPRAQSSTRPRSLQMPTEVSEGPKLRSVLIILQNDSQYSPKAFLLMIQFKSTQRKRCTGQRLELVQTGSSHCPLMWNLDMLRCWQWCVVIHVECCNQEAHLCFSI